MERRRRGCAASSAQRGWHQDAEIDGGGARPPGGAKGPCGPGRRWGWIANTTGSELLLRIDTRSGGTFQSGTEEKNEVMLSFLNSYEKMGRAKVECVNNCT